MSKICRNCRKKISTGDNRCPYCGASLEAALVENPRFERNNVLVYLLILLCLVSGLVLFLQPDPNMWYVGSCWGFAGVVVLLAFLL